MLRDVLHGQATEHTGQHRRIRRRRFLSATAIGIAAALVTLFVGAGLLARQIHVAREAFAQRAELSARNRQLQALQTLVQQAESAQRGYLLTGGPRYVESFRRAATNVPAVLAEISLSSGRDQLVAPHVRQIQRLTTLKLEELASTTRLFDAGDRDAALRLVQTGAGEQFMQSLQQEITAGLEAQRSQAAAADTLVLDRMIALKHLSWWTAFALTVVIVLAALQVRSFVRLRSTYEKQVATQASILNAIVDEIPASLAIWDRDFRYQFVNKAFEDWRGRSRNSVVGKTIAEVAGDADFLQRRPWLERALQGERVSFEKEFENGRVRHINAAYNPLRLEDGTVVGIIALAHDITAMREEREQLKTQSARDSLTGALNRAAFEAWMTEAAKVNRGEQLAVLFVDLDHFKPVNDQYGHSVGDAVLRTFAERVKAIVRPTDAVARIGGDEFAIGLSHIRTLVDAQAVAEKVVAEARKPIQLGTQTIHIGASVGVAINASHLDDGWRGLLARADEMLYAAKRAGRNRFKIHSVK